MAYATSSPAVRDAMTVSSVQYTNEDTAKLLMRLLVGVLLLVHGISKMQSGLAEIIDTLTRAGLPAVFAYLVYVGEVAAPVLMLAGLWTRVAGLVAAINMLVAVALVHTRDLLSLSPEGGYALELQAFYLFGALVVVLLGAGRYSLGGLKGRWN